MDSRRKRGGGSERVICAVEEKVRRALLLLPSTLGTHHCDQQLNVSWRFSVYYFVPSLHGLVRVRSAEPFDAPARTSCFCGGRMMCL